MREVAPALMSMFVGLAAATAVPAAEEQPAGVSTPAVWKRQKLEFHYFGRTSRYSCDGLRDKVRAMLLDMGVRNDLKVIAHGCEIGRINLQGLNPGLSLDFHAPVPRGTSDAAAAPASGGAAPAGEDARPFEARYESFNFRQDAFRNLNVGDCELVEEFVRQVLPRLTARGLKSDIACVPYQHQGGSYRVSGEVLKPIPVAASTLRSQR